MTAKIPTSINGKSVETFAEQLASGEPEVWTEECGIEIPMATWKQTRKYLRKFHKHGILFFETDDGPGMIVRVQLIGIAGAVGIQFKEIDSHRLVMWDEDRFPFANASECVMEES